MPKIVHDDVLDYGLDTIKTKVTRIGVFTTTPPSTISSAAPTALAITTASTGNFTIADSSVRAQADHIAEVHHSRHDHRDGGPYPPVLLGEHGADLLPDLMHYAGPR